MHDISVDETCVIPNRLELILKYSFVNPILLVTLKHRMNIVEGLDGGGGGGGGGRRGSRILLSVKI